MKANERSLMDDPPVAARSFAQRDPKSRRVLPTADPTRFATPKSLAQHINFRLSPAVEEVDDSHTGFSNQIYQVMPKPGRSIPKLRDEDFGATRTYDHGSGGNVSTAKKSSNPLKAVRKSVVSDSTHVKKDMLARFDEAIANPGAKVAVKATRLKKQFHREIDTKLKVQSIPDSSRSSSKIGFQKEMDKMKEQFLGNLTAELGFKFDSSKDSFKNIDNQFPPNVGNQSIMSAAFPTNPNSIEGIHSQMDGLLRNWSTDAQKMVNKHWISSSERNSRHNLQGGGGKSELKNSPQIPGGSLKKNSTPTLALPTSKWKVATKSQAKLAKISNEFRKSLQPYATQDPRELIKTPNEDMMQELSDIHTKAVNVLHKGRGTNSGLSTNSSVNEFGRDNVKLPKKSASKDGRTTRSVDISRVGSQNQDMKGLMDFRSLLEIQSGKNPKKLPKIPRGKLVGSLKSPKSITTPTIEELLKEMPSLAPISIPEQEIHGYLKDSVKTIDEAAKVAKTLGTLMSKVAIQGAKQGRGETSTTATVSGGNSTTKISDRQGSALKTPMNPYEPISVDIQKRASHLRSVADNAQRSLQQHSVSCGLDTITNKDQSGDGGGGAGVGISSNSISTGTSQIQIQTQTEEKNEKVNDFQFVSDMSFTDQLMLKKLRDLQSSWDSPK